MPKRNWKKDPKLTERTRRLAREKELLSKKQRNALDTYVSARFKGTYGVAYDDHENDRTEICLSFNYLKANKVELIDKLILHELVHWEVGIDRGHDWVFKRKAREVGTCPTHKMLEPDSGTDYKWEVRCENCGAKSGFYRRPKWMSTKGAIDSDRYCAKCNSHNIKVIRTPFD